MSTSPNSRPVPLPRRQSLGPSRLPSRRPQSSRFSPTSQTSNLAYTPSNGLGLNQSPVSKSSSSIRTRISRSSSFSQRTSLPISASNQTTTMPSYRFAGVPGVTASSSPNLSSPTGIAPINFGLNKLDTTNRSNIGFRSTNLSIPKIPESNHSLKKEREKEKSKNFICYGDQLFVVGHSDTMGRRPSMEDACVAYGEFAGIGTQYYAIFDGHGGSEVSSYCAQNMHTLISDYYENGNSFIAATKKAIKEVSDFAVSRWPQAGSTAAIAIIDDDVLYTANVGDSRIILIHNGKAKRLSIDHKAVLPEETDAIIRRGGRIEGGRVNGILMLSRAIGDGTVAKYITSEPFMTQTVLRDNAKLILACDGVWDVMDDQYAADIFLQVKNPEDAAFAIQEEAMKKGTMDNVSVICVDLNVNK